MNETTSKLLYELYEADPALREHEATLVQLIEELLKARPEAKLDPVFQAQLRNEVLARAHELTNEAQARGANTVFSLASLWPRFNFALGGIVLVLVVAVVAAVYREGVLPTRNSTGQLAFGPKVTRLGNHAFGDLAMPGSAAVARGSFGLDGGPTKTMLGPQAPSSEQSSVGSTSMLYPAPDIGMPIYQPTPYRFVYQGKELVNLASTVAVLRRVIGEAQLPAAGALVANLGLTGFDAATFSELKLSQLALSQDNDFGYSLYVDLLNGMVNVNQNSHWREPWNTCQDQGCIERYRVKEGDLLPNDEVIGLASKFLTAHGVVLADYGTPYVQDDWRVGFLKMSAAERAAYYLPDVATVVFPLMLQSSSVFEGSDKAGLNVGVSLRDKRVTGFWNLTTQKYEASDYEAITQASDVVTYAEAGGYGGGYGVPIPLMEQTAPGSKGRAESIEQPQAEVQVALGTPIQVYLKTWNYAGADSAQAVELYVPALAFPVVKVPQGVAIYQKYVLVPLVKEFWNSNQGGPIRIMPLGGGAAGSSGSAGASTGIVPPAVSPEALPEP